MWCCNTVTRKKMTSHHHIHWVVYNIVHQLFRKIHHHFSRNFIINENVIFHRFMTCKRNELWARIYPYLLRSAVLLPVENSVCGGNNQSNCVDSVVWLKKNSLLQLITEFHKKKFGIITFRAGKNVGNN